MNTNVIFALSDYRTGVDINTLKFSVDGVAYTPTSTNVTVNPDGALFRVEVNPDADFKEGASVPVRVEIVTKTVGPTAPQPTLLSAFIPLRHFLLFAEMDF